MNKNLMKKIIAVTLVGTLCTSALHAGIFGRLPRMLGKTSVVVGSVYLGYNASLLHPYYLMVKDGVKPYMPMTQKQGDVLRAAINTTEKNLTTRIDTTEENLHGRIDTAEYNLDREIKLAQSKTDEVQKAVDLGLEAARIHREQLANKHGKKLDELTRDMQTSRSEIAKLLVMAKAGATAGKGQEKKLDELVQAVNGIDRKLSNQQMVQPVPQKQEQQKTITAQALEQFDIFKNKARSYFPKN